MATGDWPDAAGVHYNRDVGCTGVLIAPDVVLTAGHCIGGVRKVILDSTDYWYPGEEIAVAEEIDYPNSWSSYDIGVLLLEKEALTPPRMIAQDCIIEDYLHDGAQVTIVGYGATDIWGTEYGTTLIEASTNITDHDCSDISSGCNPSVSPGGELGAAGGGIDACYGDSGGPLYLNTPEGDFVVGIVSRAYDYVYAPCEDWGIWVRPDAVLSWIEDVSGRNLVAPDCDRLPNQPPNPFAAPIVVVSGEVQTTSVDPNDPNLDDVHSYLISVPPLYGLAEISVDGQVSFTAGLDYEGPDELTVVVTDDRGMSGAVTVDIDVRGVDSVDMDTMIRSSGCGCAAGGTSAPWLWTLAPLILLRRRRAGG
ncbi:MAG: trypsin-like serine protease [Deltaproteobacteria bacterium]|nr:trypsin-like serine protease [Deltaproteobacteria bacterium]